MSQKNSATLVSILITAYNCEALVAQTIDSLLEQSYQPIELIVVDDGSIDLTPTILKKKASEDERIKVFFPGRLGRAKALNYGLTQCRGEFIAINDADDRSRPDRIEKQVAFLQTNLDHVLVGSRMNLFNYDTGSYVMYTDQRPLIDSEIRSYFMKGQPIQHSTVLMRRNLVEKIGGYNEGIPFLLDRDIFIRLAKHGKLANLDEYLIDLGRGNHQFFKMTYTGKQRVLLDFSYRIKAAKQFGASLQDLLKIYMLKYWSLSPKILRQMVKKIK